MNDVKKLTPQCSQILHQKIANAPQDDVSSHTHGRVCARNVQANCFKRLRRLWGGGPWYTWSFTCCPIYGLLIFLNRSD